jgi:hypothetical protein
MKHFKKGKLKDWIYQFIHGHPFLLNEEVDIICKTRLDKKYSWMSDQQIQGLVKTKVKLMYKNKFPNAKRWKFKPQNF